VKRSTYGTVNETEPVTLEYVAWITTVPEATAVTRPVAETVAVPVSADCQVAEAVTSCVVPSDMEAVAVSCEVPPTVGADPLTVMVETEAGVVIVSPHAAANAAMATTTTSAQSDRPVGTCREIVITLLFGSGVSNEENAAAVPAKTST
jgi:hypothetical protein